MRKLILFFSMAIVMLVSCQKEISWDTPIITPPVDTTGNSGDTTIVPGDTTNLECKDCLYMPTCDKSWFTYVDSSTGTATKETTTKFNYVKDTTVDAIKYRVFKDDAGKQTYYHCAGGVVKSFAYTVVNTPTGPVPMAVTVTPLKYEEPVGGTWKEVIQVNSPAPALPTINTYNYTMEAKGGTLIVLGKTYTDVLRVKQEIVSVYDGMEVSTIVQYYYYAKGIGFIKSEMESTDFFGDTIGFYRLLKDYYIP